MKSWGTALNVGRPLSAPVDVVFVLGGGFETRPFVAAEIYRGGYAKTILISLPQRHSMDFLDGRSEADLTRAILSRLDIPDSAVESLPLEVDSTGAELRAFRDYLERTKVSSAAIVTSDYHTRRTRTLMKRALGPLARDIRVVSAPVDGFSPDDWWQSQRGLSTYLLESVKLVTVMLHLG